MDRSCSRVARLQVACVLLSAVPLLAFAQKRNYNWVFGEHMWMSFANDTMVFVPMADTIADHNAAISDTLGNLVLVADEHGIRNGDLDLIAGGSATELGWPSHPGFFLILPAPGYPERYFVFITTGEDTKQAGAVEVDLGLAGGQGAVMGTTNWFAQNVTTKLAATTHANGSDYWVVLHEDGTDRFLAYALSADGLDPDPTISTTDLPFLPTIGPSNSADFWGRMTFSFQGDRLALFRQATTLDTLHASVYDFNAATGQVTHELTLDATCTTVSGADTITAYLNAQRHGGLDLDTTGRFLYFTGRGPYGWALQSDLWAGTGPQVQDSTLYVCAQGPSPFSVDTTGSQMAVGPNGHVYMRWAEPFFSQPVVLDVDYLPYHDLQLQGVGPGVFTFPSGTRICGLPNPCKRYHDSVLQHVGVASQGARVDRIHRIFPNPVSGSFTVTLGLEQPVYAVIWSDAMGRAVRSDHPLRSGIGLTLDRGSLPPGLYVLSALTPEGRTVLGTVLVE